jgi:hypothetical protein
MRTLWHAWRGWVLGSGRPLDPVPITAGELVAVLVVVVWGVLFLLALPQWGGCVAVCRLPR